MSQDRIESDVLIEAPVERVWTLLTEGEHLGSWFGDAGAEVDLRPGGAMELRWAEHGAVRARVERVEEPSAFAFRWASGMEHEPTDGASTLVEFTLAREGDGTRVSVVETGFASLDVPAEERRAKFEGNVEGWEFELGELARYATRVGV